MPVSAFHRLLSAGFMLTLMFWAADAAAQRPVAARLAPGLNANARTPQTVRVSVQNVSTFMTWAAENLPGVQVQLESRQAGVLVLRQVTSTALARLLASPQVVFIDRPTRKAHDERLLNQADLSVNAITAVHRRYPNLTGRGLTVSVKENPFDPLDLDFRGRLVNVDPAAVIENVHATSMATLIAGAGNNGPSGRGVAREARLTSHSFANLLPEPDEQLRQLDVSVQNHSYGTAIENYYGLESRDYDRQSRAIPTLLHVFSAGNSGFLASAEGRYQGLPAVANLTGQFKMSKNTLSVGASDARGSVSPQSSRGPAYDGRVKPELVAYGDAGSSDAAALVSGISLLVQQAYRDGPAKKLPSSSLVRAVLLNSANDVGSPEVDFVSGYGQADAMGAVQTVQQGRHSQGQLRQNEEQFIELNVPAGTEQLKITLAWTDPEAAANAPQALVNDLDLELLGPASGSRWLPWTLSAFPHLDSLALPARRRADHLNNNEQITLRRPAPGRYRLRVRGFQVVPDAAQEFSVAYEMTAATLDWLTPNFSRNVLPGQPTQLRWQWTGEAQPAAFFYRPVGLTAWRPLPITADLTARAATWTAPDTTTLAQLRCVTGNQEFISDTFAIADPVRLRVGYVCANDALLNWNATPGATAYQVYRLGATMLEPLQQTSDTLLLVSPTGAAGTYFAVAPILRGRPLERSITANLTDAGLSCYIRSFIPQQPVADTVRLDLTLASLYRLQAIRLQRFNTASGRFETIQTQQPVGSTTFTFTDLTAAPGFNQYRIEGLDALGQTFYSTAETVQRVPAAEIFVYPVPATIGEPLYVIATPGTTLQMRLYDVLGHMLREEEGPGTINTFNTRGLRPGLYLLRVRVSNGVEITRRVVLQ